jgi:hypothetical protein
LICAFEVVHSKFLKIPWEKVVLVDHVCQSGALAEFLFLFFSLQKNTNLIFSQGKVGKKWFLRA